MITGTKLRGNLQASGEKVINTAGEILLFNKQIGQLVKFFSFSLQ